MTVEADIDSMRPHAPGVPLAGVESAQVDITAAALASCSFAAGISSSLTACFAIMMQSLSSHLLSSHALEL
jgi:hypothetical protein